MPVNIGQYVIVNIWTSKDNKAMPGANVGHVSLETADEYISLWPIGPSRAEYKTNFFQNTEHKIKRNFGQRSASYKTNYQEDCMFESISESGVYSACLLTDDTTIERNNFYFRFTDDSSLQYKVISPENKEVSGIINRDVLAEILPGQTPLQVSEISRHLHKILKITAERGHTKEHHYRPIVCRDDLEEGEVICRINSVDRTREIWEHDIPQFIEDRYSFMAVKLLHAQFRMVLFSLDIQAIENEFNLLKNSITGWSLAGSNLLSQLRFDYETSENCSSLAFRCLNAGGLSGKLKSKLSSKTSIAISPDDLVNRIVAFKKKELIEHPQIENWAIENITVSELTDVEEAYATQGLKANAEDDFFPGLKPSNASCVIL